MMQVGRFFALLVFMLAIPSVHTGNGPVQDKQSNQTSQFEDKLNKRVDRFEASGRTIIRCILDLAYEYEIPIGIEYVNRNALTRPIDVEFHNASVREIFVGVIQQAPEYRLSISGGVVDIFAPKAREDPSNLLNKVIKDFSVAGLDTRRADLQLFCSLGRELAAPSACFGSIAAGQWGTLKITVHLQNARVYEILNAIVAENGKAVWTVMVPPEQLSKTPLTDLWHIYPLELPFKAIALDKLGSIAAE